MLCLLQTAANSHVQQLSTHDQSAWEPVTRMLSDWGEMKQGTDLRDDVLSAKLAGLEIRGKFVSQYISSSND